MVSFVTLSRVPPFEASPASASPARNFENDALIDEQLVTATTPLSSSCRTSDIHIPPSTKAQSSPSTLSSTNSLFPTSSKDNETAKISPATPTQLHHGFRTSPKSKPKPSLSKKDNKAATPSAIFSSRLCYSPEQVPTRILQKNDPRELDSHSNHFPPVTDLATDQRGAISAVVPRTFRHADQYDQPSKPENRAPALSQDIHEQEAREAGAAALLAISRRAESEESDDDEEEPNLIGSIESPIYCHGNDLRLNATQGNAIWALSKVPRNNVNLPLGTTNHEGETECNRCNLVNEALTHQRYLRGYTKCKDCRDLARSKPNCKDCKRLPYVDKRSAREKTVPLAETARDDLHGKKTWGAASYEETQSRYQTQDQTLESRQDQQYPKTKSHCNILGQDQQYAQSQCRLEPYTPRQLRYSRNLLVNNGYLNKPPPTPEHAATYPLPCPNAATEEIEQPNQEAAPAATSASPGDEISKKHPSVSNTQQACLEDYLYAVERAKNEMHTAVYCTLHEIDRDEFENQYQQRLTNAGAPTPEQRKRDADAIKREATQDMDRYMKQVYSEERMAAALYGLPIEPVRLDDGPTTLRKAKAKRMGRAIGKRNPLKELESTLLVAPPPALPSKNGPRAYTSRQSNLSTTLDLDDSPKLNNTKMTQRKKENAVALDRDLKLMADGGSRPVAEQRRHDIAMDPDNVNINAFVKSAMAKKRTFADANMMNTTTRVSNTEGTTVMPTLPPTKKVKSTLKVNPKADPAHPDHAEFMALMGKEPQSKSVANAHSQTTLASAHSQTTPTPQPANTRPKRTSKAQQRLSGN
ncbi:hypothetical protein N7G274_004237 [Stereocaulon virgatum]|uniref:Uncharacterized protein n=1 Tax=Stereocaulon virgatum TaxID=373712 RepID=A0ABR4ABD3_9LECA